MGAALILLLVGLGALAAGVLIGRYYVPDDRQLRRTAKHAKAYMRALSHLVARDHDTAVGELRSVVEENVDDVEPYFALGALFRSRGEHERAIRVHQALALRERDRRKLRQRAMYELGLDFRAAGMPRRATKAMEEVLLEEPAHEGALRVLAALYEEQARFNEAAELWQRLGRRRNEDTSLREHHLLVAAAQAALGRDDLDSARQLLKAAQKHHETAHLFAAAAELAAARGNHRGAKERLKQALIAEPALVPFLLPGLIAAEQGLAAGERSARDSRPMAVPRTDELDDDPPPRSLDGGAQKQLPAGDATASGARRADATASGARRAADATASGAGRTADATIPDVRPPDGSSAEPAADMVGAVGAAGATSARATADAAVAPVADMDAGSSGPARQAGLAELVASPRGLQILLPDDGPLDRPAAGGVPLVPATKIAASISERVLAVLTEIEAQTGPRLELALIRAQLVLASDAAAQAELAADLLARFPDALATRVATARIALASGDEATIRRALERLTADTGALAWTLRGRWQCAHCGHRPGSFSWRCGQCRRWSSLRMETGVEPPPVAPRDRRAAPRPLRADGLLGVPPDESLPPPTLDPGLSDDELARAGTRRSLLGRVGGWVSSTWRRDRR